MTGRILAVVLVAGCVSTDTARCPDGIVCPSATTCKQLGDPTFDYCARGDELDACKGKQDLDSCTLIDVAAGRCYSGVCLPDGCGNRITDTGEQCDDGNTVGGDGCSADCTSNERCGNGIVDLIGSEECDDGNNIDHDGCTSTCRPERLRWVPHTLTPPARRDAAMAYDPFRDRVVMFGGDAGYFLADLWEWTGADWTQRRLAGPGPRAKAAMAFDGKRLVLFGGRTTEGELGDTWTYDGTEWTLASTSGPPARAGHAMAYDAHRKRVVLFGGDTAAGGALGDTWEWDGAAWSTFTSGPQPPARTGAMMAYDPVRGVVVLAGGGATDVWELDGTAWKPIAPGAPSLVTGSMAFDVAAQTLVAYAATSGSDANHTYAWNGSHWTDLAAAAEPPPRHGQVMANSGGRSVMFGIPTSGGGSETWFLENGTWRQPVAPTARARYGAARDEAHGTLLLFGGTLATSGPGAPLGDTWVLSSRGWSEYTGTAPSARLEMAMNWDPVARNVLMFSGGTLPPSGIQDTWTWNGIAWSQKQPSMSPLGRVFSSLAYDGTSVVVAGGGTTSGSYYDTWRWTGADWSQEDVGALQLGLLNQSIFDRTHAQLVAHGAFQAGSSIEPYETWTHDATGWHEHAISPTPRVQNYRPAWSPPRQRVVLAESTTTVWEWDGASWTALEPAFPPQDAVVQYQSTTVDGTGTFSFGSTFGDTYVLRWEGPGSDEQCGAFDSDGDGLVGCDDPDCWRVCTPTCEPGETCDPAAPRCGDGTCDASLETCRSCPGDCACAPVCGDFICDPGEACIGDCD